MATTKTVPRSLGQKIRTVLLNGLKESGVTATVSTQKVRGTQFIRVFVYSKDFTNLWHTERQNIVWRVLNRDLADKESNHISMILTLTPDEAKGNWKIG